MNEHLISLRAMNRKKLVTQDWEGDYYTWLAWNADIWDKGFFFWPINLVAIS